MTSTRPGKRATAIYGAQFHDPKVRILHANIHPPLHAYISHLLERIHTDNIPLSYISDGFETKTCQSTTYCDENTSKSTIKTNCVQNPSLGQDMLIRCTFTRRYRRSPQWCSDSLEKFMEKSSSIVESSIEGLSSVTMPHRSRH